MGQFELKWVRKWLRNAHRQAEGVPTKKMKKMLKKRKKKNKNNK